MYFVTEQCENIDSAAVAGAMPEAQPLIQPTQTIEERKDQGTVQVLLFLDLSCMIHTIKLYPASNIFAFSCA
jgi:hypothetical protein